MDRLLAGTEIGTQIIDTEGEIESANVTSIAFDDHEVAPGALFCCVRGERFDGHDFAGAAVQRGAVGVVSEEPLELEVPQVIVRPGSVRRVMAGLSARLYGYPSRDLTMIGVTGTNGKTTVTYLVKAILETAGRPTALIGTIDGKRTTPESPVLQRLLAAERDSGKVAVSMEVSSHALHQGRVDGIRFAIAIFTNLSQDHLDYHGTMASYFEAKAELFTPERTTLGVVNADDPWGRQLLEHSRIPLRPFSVVEASDVRVGPSSASFTWERCRLNLPLGGRFNVANVIAAGAACRQLDVPLVTIAEGLSTVRSVPGRLERVDAGQPFTVVVDYAHTPTALDAVLSAARDVVKPDGKIVIVFGCGGDRDRSKRPAMGEVATRLADVAVLTSDNPRSENPLEIIEEVRSGAGQRTKMIVEPDRSAAIFLAMELARQGDVVVLAGKGHETTQDLGDRVVPFDDREVARDAILRSRIAP